MINFKDMFKLKKKAQKGEKKKVLAKDRRQKLKYYLERSGIEINTQTLAKTFFNIAVAVNLVISIYLIYFFSSAYGVTWTTVVVSMIVLWSGIFALLILSFWLMFYIFIDLRIFKRRVDIEDVLPEFLQLTASNINAGMTIDRALWFAVRPRFGVLAKEMEMIAKQTMSGVDLKIALENFAGRYNSIVLKSSISMLNEGIEAGGEISDLLNRISLNLQEQKTMLNEISASVTSYVIFITFASIVAAPFLFAMSGILIQVVKTLGANIGGSASVSASAGIPLAFSNGGVDETDFRTFSIVSLMITALFSAMMVSTIKKGNIKSGVKYIPIFIAVSLLLYFLSRGIAGKVLEIIIPK